MPGLFRPIEDAYESALKRVTTGELSRFVERLEFDRDIKVCTFRPSAA